MAIFKLALYLTLILGIFAVFASGTRESRLEKRSSHHHGSISDLVHSGLRLLTHHRLKRSSHSPLKHLRKLLHRDKRTINLFNPLRLFRYRRDSDSDDEIRASVLRQMGRLRPGHFRRFRNGGNCCRNQNADCCRRNPRNKRTTGLLGGRIHSGRVHRFGRMNGFGLLHRNRRDVEFPQMPNGRIHSSHMHRFMRMRGNGMRSGQMHRFMGANGLHSSHLHRMRGMNGFQSSGFPRLSRRSILEGYAAYRMGRFLRQRAEENGGVEGIPYVLIDENEQLRRKRTAGHVLNWFFNGNDHLEPEKWYNGRYYYQPIYQTSGLTGQPCDCCVPEPENCLEPEEPEDCEEPEKELFVEPPNEETEYEEPPSEEYEVPGSDFEENIEFEEYPELPEPEKSEENPEEFVEFEEIPIDEAEEQIPVVQIG